MLFLSQAPHLGYLPSPHGAFQGHAAHVAQWLATLSPKGSWDACTSQALLHSHIALSRRTESASHSMGYEHASSIGGEQGRIHRCRVTPVRRATPWPPSSQPCQTPQ